MPKKIPKEGEPESHDELKGFDIKIDEFGEIQSTISVDNLNEFLNKNLEDKKISQAQKEGHSEEE